MIATKQAPLPPNGTRARYRAEALIGGRWGEYCEALQPKNAGEARSVMFDLKWESMYRSRLVARAIVGSRQVKLVLP